MIFVFVAAAALLILLAALESKASVRLKENVNLQGLKPQTLFAIQIAQEVFGIIGQELVITSANDSRHMEGSKHFAGEAFDARSKHLTEAQKELVLTELRARLGRDYDVLLESRGTENEHYHVEFDPKG